MEDERWRRFMRHMRHGEFEAAWQISDSILAERLNTPRFYWPRHVQYLWNGKPLEGKRVLVRCCHGLGDTVQFIRYLPMLGAKTAAVTVRAQTTLIPLLKTMPAVDRVMPLHNGMPDSERDIDIEVMELPYIFRTTIDSIPASVPYFGVEPAPIRKKNICVGIAWRGGPWDRRRDVPFRLISKLTEVPGTTFYALDKYPFRSEFHEKVRYMLNADADALVTAGIIQAMDVVISIDSLPAHLAGALAVPTWLLLQSEPDWRWMENRTDTPWYPTMRLFRQKHSGDWTEVIERVQAELMLIAESSIRASIASGRGQPPMRA